jgi:hypothetical protein
LHPHTGRNSCVQICGRTVQVPTAELQLFFWQYEPWAQSLLDPHVAALVVVVVVVVLRVVVVVVVLRVVVVVVVLRVVVTQAPKLPKF